MPNQQLEPKNKRHSNLLLVSRSSPNDSRHRPRDRHSNSSSERQAGFQQACHPQDPSQHRMPQKHWPIARMHQPKEQPHHSTRPAAHWKSMVHQRHSLGSYLDRTVPASFPHLTNYSTQRQCCNRRKLPVHQRREILLSTRQYFMKI